MLPAEKKKKTAKHFANTGDYCEPSLCAHEMKTWATDFPSCTPATFSIG
jgi:hypothetical protein